jgi:mRNA-degrading endonuclease RelE of RelBE toxin-antitoxin system
MVVRIDISKLPSHLRHALMNEIGLNNRSRKSSSDSKSELSDIDKNNSDIVDEVIIVDENNSHTTTRKVKDALIKNRIGDYVAIKHPEEEGKVLVLTRGDAERQGTYHCRHCGMEFNDSVKLSIHLRLHYMIA